MEKTTFQFDGMTFVKSNDEYDTIYAAGLYFFDKEEYKTSFGLLSGAAKKGHKDAQAFIAEFFPNGYEENLEN